MISEIAVYDESSYARTSTIMHDIIANVLQHHMTWHATHEIPDLAYQDNAFLAATTMCRASFNNASTSLVGTPFLLSTSTGGACALNK